MTDSNEDPSANGDDRRPQENVHREIHDWTSAEPLNSTILTALADVKDVEPTELEPLYEHIDPDALESLFDPDGDGLRTDGHVSFSFADHYVTIHGHGEYAVISLAKSRRSLSIFAGGGEKIDDAAAFESALQHLVRTAAQNGVRVTGGWVVQSPSEEAPDWDVHITDIVRRNEGTDRSE